MIEITLYLHNMKFSRLKYFIVIVITIAVESCSTSSFFYVPTKKMAYYPDTSIFNVEEINFNATDGKVLNAWFLKPKQQSAIATVLQFHGNGGNISYQFQFAEPLIKAGFQVMVFDYEGYGNSTGTPSQEKVLDDGIQALQYIKQREDVKNTKLILFGQSLGGHLACVVAAQQQKLIDALIIEGAFTGHKLMAVYVAHKYYHAPKWLAKVIVPTRYDAIDQIEKVTVPKLIIHSTEDATCPFYMGKELYDKAIAPKQFWEIKGAHIQASNLYSNEFVKHFVEILK